MSRLIYCAYPVIDRAEEPDWVGKLLQNPIVLADDYVVYRPLLGFAENVKSAGMLSVLTRAPKLTVQQARDLRIDPAVFEPLANLQGRLVLADRGPFLDVAFKRLYALLRADILLVDLNVPDHGCRSQEAMYAYLAGIPVVGIAHRFIISPTMLEKVEAVVFPRTSDQIARQVLAFDHKVTAAIHQYRSAQQLEDLSGRAAELTAELTAEKAEQPDGGDESTRPV